MKSLTVMSTQLTKDLRDYNQEIRLRLSSMPFATVQETESCQHFLEKTQKILSELENSSSIIYHHLNLLKIELQEQQQRSSSKD